MALITGKVVFEQGVPSFESAVLTVKLEDVSLMDVPSKVVLSDSKPISGGNGPAFEFALTTEEDHSDIDLRATYNISAHLSLHPEDNPNDIRQGDYLTVQSYPVLTHGHPTDIVVRVKRVG